MHIVKKKEEQEQFTEAIAKLPGTSKAAAKALSTPEQVMGAATAKAPPGPNGIPGANGAPPPPAPALPVNDMKEISPALAALMGDCL